MKLQSKFRKKLSIRDEITAEVIPFLMFVVVISALNSLEFPQGIKVSHKSQLSIILMEEKGLTV